jgi:hypothetical protein
MKKLTVFLAGLVMGLILIPGGTAEALAQEKTESMNRDSLLSASVIINQMEEGKIDKSFLYQESGPLRPERVTGEFLLGGAGALLGGAIGGSIGYAMAYDESEGDWFNFSGLYGAIPGYLIASNLGCALGVYLIGNTGDEKGSFGSALGGSVAGTLAGMGVSYLLIQTAEHDEITVPIFVLFTAAQSTGAIIGFNLSREKKLEASSGALLNLNEKKLSLAFPQLGFSQGSFNSSSYKVNLFQAKF